MTPNLTDPRAIADAANKIYEERYKADYEARFPGKYAAINIADQSATVGETSSSTLSQARQNHPGGLFHLIRIGHAGTFDVGFSHRYVHSSRVY